MPFCATRRGPAQADELEPPFGIVARAPGCGYCRAMNRDDEKRIAAKLARIMAMLCVRNTHLETIHAGMSPITRTGDYSDVFVVDADGRRILWTDVSHINEDEMRDLMRDIVNRLYTFHLCADDPKLQAQIERWMGVSSKWDEPEIDPRMISRSAE
jgi:hypothetical protein